jgi:hypothetical protein
MSIATNPPGTGGWLVSVVVVVVGAVVPVALVGGVPVVFGCADGP